MADAIKTWPAKIGRPLHLFLAQHTTFYLTLGRGQPQRALRRLFICQGGKIVGWFPVEEVVQNVGQLPRLHSIEGTEWRIKPDRWVAVCPGPLRHLREQLYYRGFRGWRYFDLRQYKGTLDAHVPF